MRRRAASLLCLSQVCFRKRRVRGLSTRFLDTSQLATNSVRLPTEIPTWSCATLMLLSRGESLSEVERSRDWRRKCTHGLKPLLDRLLPRVLTFLLHSAALEKRIEELTFSQSVSESSSSSTPSSASAKTPPSMTDTSYIGDNFGSTDYDLFASTTDYLATRATYPNVSGGPLFSSSDPQAIMEASDFFSRSHAHGGRPLMPIPTPIILPASSELLCPGWPLTLPSPHLVTTICQTYFSKIHATTDLLNKAKFFSCLALPPTDKRFPITPLLHAIIATASGFVSEDVWQGEQRYWGPNETPSDWHLTQAKVN